MQPGRTAFVPLEAASEHANGIEVTFEISERKVTACINQIFLTRRARRTDGENASFNGFISGYAVARTNFKKQRIALAVIQIPFQRRSHRHYSGRTQNA